MWSITRGFDITLNVIFKWWKGKIHLQSAAFAQTAFSGAVFIGKAAVQPRRQQANPAHTDFDLYRHTAARRPVTPEYVPPEQLDTCKTGARQKHMLHSGKSPTRSKHFAQMG